MDLASLIPIGNLGFSGVVGVLLALQYRAMVRGDLVPRATHDAIVEKVEEHNKDLRVIADRERDGHIETLRQLDVLTEGSKTTVDLLTYLRDRTGVQGEDI